MEYERLGSSGLKVSKIILGCMTFGSSKWSPWVLDEEQSLPLLKAAYDAGINTWDTADVYSDGVSEVLIRKAIEKYKIPRKRLVIMTKCFNHVNDEDEHDDSFGPNWVNQKGLSRKYIFDAVDASLARLGTPYIDVLQIHRLDRETPPEEIMEALHEIVQSGKVRYIGASSMKAHEFVELQFIATRRGWTKFVSMQNFYNLLYREEEREMIPFCKKTGVGLIPWSPLACGVLTRPYHADTPRSLSDQLYKNAFGAARASKTRSASLDEEITNRVEKVARAKGVPMAAVATAWVLSKGASPIVGLNSEKRIREAVEALRVILTEEEVRYLEEVYEPKRA
ncbi:Aldo/keto reductase [Exidia glandulosa HHB12029]|uniref:Aldo/keto reductase n=1 Tax=Exidia glandulosa HHB12029 TaxID=1314781 RepID=A0A165KV52_EXIGL|nr:Aldo/keto reductase [Exidia glandulosa HHB12029]